MSGGRVLMARAISGSPDFQGVSPGLWEVGYQVDTKKMGGMGVTN